MSRSGKEGYGVFYSKDYLLHYLPGDSALVRGLSQERNREVFHTGGSNTKNNRPCNQNIEADCRRIKSCDEDVLKSSEAEGTEDAWQNLCEETRRRGGGGIVH